MNSLFLHIGRHKTGTTAIQRFLMLNRSNLFDQGFFVPFLGVKGYGHHEIAEPMQRRNKLTHFLLKRSQSMRELYLLLEKNQEHVSILSSEAFQNCDPKFVRNMFVGYNTTIVVYIRDQLNYLASSYAQKVHATNYTGSLGEYYDNVYRVDYWKFLSEWGNSFKKQLIVRKFDKQALENGDVVQDFIRHVLPGADTSLLEFSDILDSNPSLNEKVLQLKLTLNQSGRVDTYNKGKLYRLLPELNKEFPSCKYTINSSIKRKVINDCFSSDSKVAAQYFGESILFAYDDYQARETSILGFDELNSMEKVLYDLYQNGLK